jgi:LysM repeat protein
MADPATALANLQAAIAGSLGKSGSLTLNSAYLTAGLGDPDVTVPADYDATLGQSFQVSASAFNVAGPGSGVGPVTSGQFTVSGVTVPIIGGTQTAPATLLFTTVTDSGATVLIVQIASIPASWNWSTSFPYATGFPFDQVPLSGTKFYFSTATGFYPWGDTSGVAVNSGAMQALEAQIAFPESASPYLALFADLAAPTSQFPISGTLDLTLYGGPDFTSGVLLPVGTFNGQLSSEQFTFAGYLNVSAPGLTLIIPSPDVKAMESPDAVMGANSQTPTLVLTSDLLLEGAAAGSYQLQVQITLPIHSDTQISYGVSLVPLTTQLLGPADAIALIGGKGSYFDETPAYLQQYLTSFGLTGTSISGLIGGDALVTVGQVAVGLGTPQGVDLNWEPLPAPTPQLSFTIHNFALEWRCSTPFATPSFSYLFRTSFSILPDVFKSADGSDSDGVFEVEFTSDQTFLASFDGTASLGDFLSTVSGGLVPSPQSIGVDVEVSDIKLQLNYANQTFAFSSGVEADLSFLTVGDHNIFTISGAMVNLSASSPSNPAAGTGTVWAGNFSGLVTICGLGVNVDIGYDGASTQTGWTLGAALEEPVDVTSLIDQFFPTETAYVFPSFLGGDLIINSLAATCFIPDDEAASNAYTVSTTFEWIFKFGDQQVEIDDAAITVAYDGTNFSGSAEATWLYPTINLALGFGYTFEADGNTTLYVTWEGFTGTYASTETDGDAQKTVTFTVKGWSLGTLITSLVTTLGDPYFTLPSPWDMLNQISLDGLSITVSLEDGEPMTLSGKYELSTPLNLGFIIVNGLSVMRSSGGEVLLSLDAEVPDALKGTLGNLTEPEGQSVQDMPSVPGQGSEYFQLNLLALGQRVAIYGTDSFDSTAEAIKALENIPSTDSNQNPIIPSNTTAGAPYYDASSNWLIAFHLNLLKTGDVWTIDLQVVFNDPNLYALRLEVQGNNPLAGMVIDVLYKKITDDIGLFQVDFIFPDNIRNLNFGSVSVVLPSIGVQIYTNGDFVIDLGFPYNMDFTQSFSVSAIVFGVPVLGSGGVYFGRLSNATATQVPTTDLGTFNPVTIIGLGLQVGLGYNFTAGPLSAGFALTEFGIIQGVIATYHPYVEPSSPPNTVQDTNYFYLQGTVGLIGMLYGTIDFQIITASVLVNITLSVSITYESFEPIYINATASVRASVSIRINLGLFSIRISLSYSTSVSVSFVIDLDAGTAPWYSDQLSTANTRLLSTRHGQFGRGYRRRGWRGRALPNEFLKRNPHLYARAPQPSRVAASDTPKPVLNLVVAPQFTVLAPEGATTYAAQQGAFVCQFAMDAPDPTATADNTPDALNSSFEMLCAGFFPWLIDLMAGETAAEIDLVASASQTVTLDTLQNDLYWIGTVGNVAFTTADLLTFLSDTFTLNIVATAPSDDTNHILFPMFDGLVLTVPDPAGGSGTKTIALETYTAATSAYCDAVAAELRQAAASTSSNKRAPVTAETDPATQSMASLVFVDVFTIIARALLQAGIDAFGSYAYPLPVDTNNQTASIAQIIATLNGYGNNITTDDIAVPNADYDLNTGVTLSLAGLTSIIQAGDTLTKVAERYSDPDATASRWSTSPADLITSNGDARILLAGTVLTLTVGGEPVTYTTQPGDTFNHIATETKLTLAELSLQSSLYGLAGFLAPTNVIAISAVSYVTAPGDTLDTIAHSFATTASLVALDNAEVANLFVPGEIAVAGLEALLISQLWTSITATSEIAQAGGQVASFLGTGLRLPAGAGLTLSSDFLYPPEQSEFALAQLTGQQFPTPAAATDYSITIGRADQSHEVDLDFITFGGSSATSIEVDLDQAYGLLAKVLTYAQGGQFVPAPTGANTPLVMLKPRQYTAASYSMWSTSDHAALTAVTGGGANSVAATPYLWSLPQALVNAVQNQQASLGNVFDAAVGEDYQKIVQLMPAFQPRKGVTTPNDPATSFTDLADYAFATRIDFQIARLSAPSSATVDGKPLSTAGGNDSPIYQLVGPSSGDAQLLQYLLTGLAALGPNLISGLFVLTSAGGTNVTTLTGQADSAFLSFISQTNLSTQSNPSTGTTTAQFTSEASVTTPNGIVNTPGQFITLMWEQSVVKGGGYYFYWEDLASGTGLPAEIFDESGTATLTLVVTLAPGLTVEATNTIANFVNAFVTTDNIDPLNDVIVVESQSTTASSAPLIGSETLTEISAVYGVGIGTLAQSNSNAAVVKGTNLPVFGILHQLTVADTQDTTQTLNNLAAYYSVGAVSAITGNDIATANPNVQVVTGATFAIPAITYVVDPALAPGNSFASMASYYALSLEAIAVQAANVPGLFAADTMLTINTLVQDTQATQPPDNLSFTLSRANFGVAEPLPPNPTAEEVATFCEQTLYALYNSLSAGLAANPYFNASSLGLPFGPQNHGAGESGNAALAADDPSRTVRRKRLSPRQAALARSQGLAALADEPNYAYSQVLSFAGNNGQGLPFARINPAPASPAVGLPPASANPYIGIGTYASVALRWQDMFGNITVTPFEQVPQGYTGWLNNAPAPLRYIDRLIPLTSWPKTKASYIYTGDSGAPVLNLSLEMDIKSYDAKGKAVDAAKQDLATYQTIYFQLNQDYTGLDVPGVTGNAVTMTLRNTLLAAPDQVLSDSQAQIVRDFVAACVIFLDNYVSLQTLGQAPQATLLLPLDIGAVAPENLIRLDVSFALTRNATLVEPLIAGLSDGVSVRSAILPFANGSDPTAASSYTKFATQLETCLKTPEWSMRTGAGLSPVTSGASSQTDQLYAARFATSTGQGIYFEIGANAGYYAPLPVATSLTSGAVQLSTYTRGGTTTQSQVNFIGIDLNLWFETCLAAIDKFLSASYAPPAYILDQINGDGVPAQADQLDKILAAKQSLADAITGTIAPILSSSPTDASTLAAATNAISQQLLTTLAPAFTAGTVVVFGLTDVSGADGADSGGPPSLYGQPAGVPVDGSLPGNQNFSLSSAKLPLAAASNGDAPRLAFNLTTKNVNAQSYIGLDLAYQITHMEFERSQVPGIDNYVESQWLVFINPLTSNELGIQYVPVLNRALPVPPTVQTQTATFGNASGSTEGLTPAQLAIWDYAFTYTYASAAQDEIGITITLNAPPSVQTAPDLNDTDPLFTALADFITSYPAISADLDTYLLKIDGKTNDATLVASATAAVEAFQTRVTAVASAYAEIFGPAVGSSGPGVTTPITFDAKLEADAAGDAVLCLRDVTIAGLAATYDNASGTITNGTITLSAPVVEILPDAYTATAVNPPPQGVTLAYKYLPVTGSGSADPLTFANALAETGRTVTLPGLNVMVYNNGQSSLLVQRNTILTPDDQVETVTTNPDFLYETPIVTFSDPVLPKIVWPSYPLRQVAPTNGNLVTDYLTAFFADLFTGASGTLRLGMAGGYSYSIAPSIDGLPKTYLPINLLQPVETAIEATSPPAAAIDVAKQINDWFDTKQPSTQSGAMDFNLSLFADSDTEQLLFVIKDLYFGTDT